MQQQRYLCFARLPVHRKQLPAAIVHADSVYAAADSFMEAHDLDICYIPREVHPKDGVDLLRAFILDRTSGKARAIRDMLRVPAKEAADGRAAHSDQPAA